MTATPDAYDASTLFLCLGAQQRRVRGILEGLDDHALRQPVLPSGWSCAGMVQHLTLSTRFWFVEVMAGQQGDPAVDDEFHLLVDSSAATIIESYQDQAQAAVALVRQLPLDTPPAWWPDGMFGEWRLDNLREVLLHVLVETTCHAGHLDAARELIDGRTWDYAAGRLSDPRSHRVPA